jgi:hypothetical protein
MDHDDDEQNSLVTSSSSAVTPTRDSSCWSDREVENDHDDISDETDETEGETDDQINFRPNSTVHGAHSLSNSPMASNRAGEDLDEECDMEEEDVSDASVCEPSEVVVENFDHTAVSNTCTLDGDEQCQDKGYNDQYGWQDLAMAPYASNEHDSVNIPVTNLLDIQSEAMHASPTNQDKERLGLSVEEVSSDSSSSDGSDEERSEGEVPDEIPNPVVLLRVLRLQDKTTYSWMLTCRKCPIAEWMIRMKQIKSWTAILTRNHITCHLYFLKISAIILQNSVRQTAPEIY